MPRSYTHPVRLASPSVAIRVELDEREFSALATSSHLSPRPGAARRGGAQPGVRETGTDALKAGTFRINQERELLNTSRARLREPPGR
jgi:hypothetical protein